MGSSDNKDYCAFTKAVEHLGDRWSLLIVRELFQFGPQGFNQLATGLPGPISRSVLAARLRKLEAVGVVARLGSGRSPSYTLAPAGERLVPTLKSLWQWAEQWVPEDPAMAQRDPTVIMWWLTHRVDVAAAPERQVVLDLAMFGQDAQHSWLLIARDAEPTLCREDPMLDPDRYVYVEADAARLYPIARGILDWKASIADGSVHLYGDPALVDELPTWFLPVDIARTVPASPATAAVAASASA
ncbi:MAG TPA: helix-turn-helix domain-containing protein [Candidatus Limnocylindria bacterium]|nr:helix-turn-helix domain-containing protein [Candidatus Limnocylindria bacterium]